MPKKTIANGGRRPDVRGDWKKRFLKHFAETRSVARALELTPVDRSTAYTARKTDPEFGAAWLEVEDAMVDEMEAEAYRRAVEGVSKPVVSAGKYVTDVTEYSDSLLQFLLRHRRPDVYRERTEVQHSGEIGARQTTMVVLDPALSAQALDLLSKAAAAEPPVLEAASHDVLE